MCQGTLGLVATSLQSLPQGWMSETDKSAKTDRGNSEVFLEHLTQPGEVKGAFLEEVTFQLRLK